MVERKRPRKSRAQSPDAAQVVEEESAARRPPRASDAELDLAFHALSDSSRRHILDLLREAGELRVTDVAKAFTISLNGVSKHLKVLERAGLIERRVEWREHFVSVAWERLEQPHLWLDSRAHYWDKRIDALEAYLERQNPDGEKQ
jgi:DNA-binding transcriptional ArsR family regulator